MNSLDANIRNTNTKGELSALRNNGSVPAVIYGGKTQNETVSISKKLGIEQIFCAAPDDYLCDSIDHNEWIKFSQRLNNVCKKLNDNGIKFGWHNHNWEFMNLKNALY